ncbi:hypothetical protein ACQKMN_16920 [Ureibacillus composti]
MMQSLHPIEMEVTYEDELNPTKNTRVVKLGDKVLSEREIEEEERDRVLMYDLFQGAQALRLAEKLERERDQYCEELYQFSYGVCSYDSEGAPYLTKTDSIVFQIIDLKDSYDKRIKKLKKRYNAFRSLLSTLTEEDSQILRDYFERGRKVEYEFLRACIGRVRKPIESYQKTQEKQLDAEAMDAFKEQRRLKRENDIKEQQEEQKQLSIGKKHCLINGEFVYLTEEEYEDYLKGGTEYDRNPLCML